MEVLRELGFSRIEAEVYIFLCKEGTKSHKELAQVLMMTERQIRQSMKSLESKKVIVLNSDPLLSVVVFEELLSNYIKKEMRIADEIGKNKEELMEYWEKVLESKDCDKQIDC